MPPIAKSLGTMVQQLRKQAAARDADRLADQHLLQRYVAAKDEAAYACLVKRYGPMVLGVCRKILRHEQDAEDAFQAAFLVLAKKAGTIRKQQSVGGWLYGVAFRVASKLRAAQARRRLRENPLADDVPARAADDLSWRDVQLAVYAELDRLSDKYRAPLLLCYLQGKTRDEAAQQLGCGVGVLRGRLDRARELLRSRLGRRGLGLSTALLALEFAEKASADFLPAFLFSSTVKAALCAAKSTVAAAVVSAQAAALTQGVIQAMFLTKVKTLAVALAATVLVSAGIGVASYQSSAQEPDPAAGRRAPKAKQARQADDDMDPRKLRLELERLRLELEKTRLELVRTQRELVILKARAEADKVKAVRQAEQAALIDYLRAAKVGGPALKAADPRIADPAAPDRIQTESPDKRTRAVADGNAVNLFDIATGKQMARALGHTAPITALVFSPDGRTVISGSSDKSVTFWDTATLRTLRKFSLSDAVGGLAASPDGKLLAVAAGDTIALLDIATGAQSGRAVGHTAPVSAVAFSPDGRLIASGSKDKSVALWDAATLKELRKFSLPAPVRSVTFSPDARNLIIIDNARSRRVFDVRTGQETGVEAQKDTSRP